MPVRKYDLGLIVYKLTIAKFDSDTIMSMHEIPAIE